MKSSSLTPGLWIEPGFPTKGDLTNHPLKCESELSQNLRYFDKVLFSWEHNVHFWGENLHLGT